MTSFLLSVLSFMVFAIIGGLGWVALWVNSRQRNSADDEQALATFVLVTTPFVGIGSGLGGIALYLFWQ